MHGVQGIVCSSQMTLTKENKGSQKSESLYNLYWFKHSLNSYYGSLDFPDKKMPLIINYAEFFIIK